MTAGILLYAGAERTDLNGLNGRIFCGWMKNTIITLNIVYQEKMPTQKKSYPVRGLRVMLKKEMTMTGKTKEYTNEEIVLIVKYGSLENALIAKYGSMRNAFLIWWGRTTIPEDQWERDVIKAWSFKRDETHNG